MGKVPRRKRLYHKKKRGQRNQIVPQPPTTEPAVVDPSNTASCMDSGTNGATSAFNTGHANVLSAVDDADSSTNEATSAFSSVCPNVSSALDDAPTNRDSCAQFVCNTENFHDYILTSSYGAVVEMSSNNLPEEYLQPSVESVPLQSLLSSIQEKLHLSLSPLWLPILREDSVHVVLTSRGSNITIQRNVKFFSSGNVELLVHCHPVDIRPILKKVSPPVSLRSDTVNMFVDRVVAVVTEVKSMEVCSGIDDQDLKECWKDMAFGEIDNNPYQECRYQETFRSQNCQRLVKQYKWRCSECTKLLRPLKRRSQSMNATEPSLYTPNIHLSESQKLKKLQEQHKQIVNYKKTIIRMQARMQELLNSEGVDIDDELSRDLMQILNGSNNVTPAQSIFLQQQIKASQGSNKRQMRWHPTMIRLALSLQLTSPAAYEMLRDTGMVKLPSSRTLFDYSHVKPAQEGIDEVVVNSVSNRLNDLEHSYQRYHVLMADEMHISQNLVLQKSTNRIVGYTRLDNIDKEVEAFERCLENPDAEAQETLASKVMVYMIKGVSSGIKEIVATYGVHNLSANQMYVWTWQVIGALERSGISIIAFVSDGCSVNRAFVKANTPVSVVPSGIVFDTVNKAAPSRVLYFMSDVPHLLKTIRNCLLNSRWDKKKSRRRMTRRGKKISWDFVIKLYNLKKEKSLRKSFKLSPMNVYPDSYGRMKVKFAAQVLSRTVAQDLEDQGWEEATETISFIRFVNDWFDCLNGAHSSVGKKKRNKFLEPYTSCEDDRFQFVLSFLDYLEDWKEEATREVNEFANVTVESDVGGQLPIDESMEIEEEKDENETPSSKRILSYQTLQGIEGTTRAFVPMVKFLLQEGTKFVNARVFTQDPLEQHFSKVRAGQGGSTNPNIGQVLNRNRALHTIGQLGMRRKRGNVGEDEGQVEVTVEPLPKRKVVRKRKFDL